MQAVRALARGERVWTPAQIARLQRWWDEVGSRLEVLTERERQVLVLVAEALSDREIAQRLSLSRNTVHWHVRNMLSKLDLKTRQEAVVFSLVKLSGAAARSTTISLDGDKQLLL